MTPGLDLWLVLALLAVAAAVLILAGIVQQGLRAALKAVHDKPVTSPVHQDMVAQLRRIAIATEAFNGNDKLVAEREHVAGQLEQFVIAFDEVTRAEFPADEALRPDVVIGQDRGVQLMKDLLREKVAEATSSS